MKQKLIAFFDYIAGMCFIGLIGAVFMALMYLSWNINHTFYCR